MKTLVASLLAELPAEWPAALQPDIRRRVLDSERTVVVLDDDPTGTQTVHDLPVITDWTGDWLKEAFAENLPVFYILTNTRGMPVEDACRVTREIASALRAAGRETGRRFSVISRSDSTLRGHFPAETETLCTVLALREAVTILMPFFEAGGRITVDNVHYVVDGEYATPVAETPFAQDSVFGFTQSDLRRYVVEKTNGRVATSDVFSVTLTDIRSGGPQQVASVLKAAPDASFCVVNSVTLRDAEVFAAGLLEAESDGKRFLCRTAASFVQARCGLETRPLLEAPDLISPAPGGGLVVVGSHVPKTTGQLQYLLKACPDWQTFEISVPDVLKDADGLIDSLSGQLNAALKRGEHVVAYTSREKVFDDDPDEDVAISRKVSNALVALVASLTEEPRFLVAKGGITASDVATDALHVRRAEVEGQILPGVPVWRLGKGSRFPGLHYVVFPGNVGGEDALFEAVKKLSQSQ